MAATLAGRARRYVHIAQPILHNGKAYQCTRHESGPEVAWCGAQWLRRRSGCCLKRCPRQHAVRATCLPPRLLLLGVPSLLLGPPSSLLPGVPSLLLEVVHAVLGVGLDGGAALLPVGGAHLQARWGLGASGSLWEPLSAAALPAGRASSWQPDAAGCGHHSAGLSCNPCGQARRGFGEVWTPGRSGTLSRQTPQSGASTCQSHHSAGFPGGGCGLARRRLVEAAGWHSAKRGLTQASGWQSPGRQSAGWHSPGWHCPPRRARR